LPPENFTLPMPAAADPPAAPPELDAPLPPFAHTEDAPQLAPLKYVSPPDCSGEPPLPTKYATMLPGASVRFVILEYAPPPAPPPPEPVLERLSPPPPPPITSIELFDGFQSAGTVQVEPEVRKIVVVAAGPQFAAVTPAGGLV